MMDEEYHGRELRRLERKMAKLEAGGPVPAFDELVAFRTKLDARPATRTVKEVRDVFREVSSRTSTKDLNELNAGEV